MGGVYPPGVRGSVAAMPDLEVRRGDLRATRIVDGGDPGDRVADGEALLRIDRFALTANNVTYGVMGDTLGYWQFFPPTGDGWGRVPAWGYADVVASAVDGLEPGERFYGFVPMSSHLTVRPKPGGPGFADTTEHRASLPAVYNRYLRVDPAAPFADEQLLLRPLFGTSFVLEHFLRSSDWFGAGAVALGSASSKTAYGLAFLLNAADDAPRTIGLTSARNRAFVESLGLYHRVLTYEAVALGDEALVYVDMSGDAGVRASVHRAAGERLRRSVAVGATHWEEADAGTDDLPGPAPELFFAPTHIERLTEELGGPELQRRMAEAWGAFAPRLSGWMEIDRVDGADAVTQAWLALVDGTADPRRGLIAGL